MPRDDAKDPFEQLERCHRRLEEACDALGPATEAEDRQTIEDVLAFLERQIKRHEEDEDDSLFPRLAGNTDLAGPIAQLAEEHKKHAALQAQLKAALAANDWPKLRQTADELARAYRDHIALEEGRIFPAAQAALTTEARTEMRREMDARRGK
jgi:hemerythrin-like domain-containing protein